MDNLINPNELQYRPQWCYTAFLNKHHYSLIATYRAGYKEEARLIRHNRNNAIWLIQDNVARVVKPDVTLKLLLDLLSME